MRTLSSTLAANQKSTNVIPLAKVVFVSGVTTYTYYQRPTIDADCRVLKIEHDEDGAWSQKATITLSNDDKVVSALTLYGYQVTISYGANDVSAGDEYSACAPLYVTQQREDSLDDGQLIVKLTCEGKPNLLARDKALDTYLPSASDTKTIKTLIGHVMGATVPFTSWVANTAYVVNDYIRPTTANGYAYKCTVAGTSHAATEPTWVTTIGQTNTDGTVTWECASTDNPFSGQTAYTATFDSEDALIDVVTPKNSFRIYFGESRLAVLRKLLDKTGCVARFEDDGELHIFVPQTTYLQDYYNTGANTYEDIFDTDWAAQTFTTTIGYNITSVKLLLRRFVSPGTLTVSIKATAAGVPTGADLCVGTYDANTINSLTPEWIEITFGNGAKLSPLTQYAIVARCLTGTFANEVLWRHDATSPTYTGGSVCASADSGATWTADATIDALFECYGYDYSYSLVAGEHNFFSKAYQKALVIPNQIIIKSQTDDASQYQGSYTDSTSYALLPITQPYQTYVVSDAEATAIATAMICKLVQQSQQGYGHVPMNAGQEVHDYVLITDARAGDTRYGNVGWIHRRYDILKGKNEMTFGFGKPEVGQRIDELINELNTYSSEGELVPRLAVKDLFVENIHADSLTLVSIDDIADGTTFQRVKSASLTADGLVLLDQVSNGSTYGLVLQTQLNAGALNLTNSATYAAGYDPSTKRRNFTATPTTPYDLGDLWHDATVVKRCTTARASGAYNAADWTAQTLDTIADGTSFARVDAADLTSNHLNLTTNTYAGGTLLSSIGVYIESTGIRIKGDGVNSGRFLIENSAGTDQVWANASGQLVAGAGAVFIDANGIVFDRDSATPNLIFKSTAGGVQYGGLTGYTLGGVHYLRLNADNVLYLSSATGTIKIGGSLGASGDYVSAAYLTAAYITTGYFSAAGAYFYTALGGNGGYIYVSGSNFYLNAQSGTLYLSAAANFEFTSASASAYINCNGTNIQAVALPSASGYPTGMPEGSIAYQTTTHKAAIYNGSNWIEIM